MSPDRRGGAVAGLDALLQGAETASPETRIEFRDPIAGYGIDAIGAVAPWLSDARLGGFAARVITMVGRQGHHAEAAGAFVGAIGSAGSESIGRDIQAGIAEFGVVTRRAPASRRSGYEVLDEDAVLRGRPAIRYRIDTHQQAGHFNVPREIMDRLGIPTDGNVDLDVHRSKTGGLVFSGPMGIASGTEIYATADDPSSVALRGLRPYESIDVTVAKDM